MLSPIDIELGTPFLRRDERALAELARDLAGLDGQIEALQQQMDNIALRLGASTTLRRDVGKRYDALLADVQRQQRALAPFERCPEEILGAIFVHLTSGPDPLWDDFSAGSFNIERARAPFTVSAVSRHWRHAALGTASIWNYASVPPLLSSDDFSARTVARIGTIVQRSGASPIDILFEDIADWSVQAYQDILRLLYGHIHRWRNCEIWCGASVPVLELYAFFRGKAPLLEEVCIHHPGGASPPNHTWPEHNDVYFMQSTKLWSIQFDSVPVPISATTSSHPLLDSVTVTACPEMPPRTFWGSFSAVHRLTILSLTVQDATSLGPPPTTDFPLLNKLFLHGDATRFPILFPTIFGDIHRLEKLTLDYGTQRILEHRLIDMHDFFGRPGCSLYLSELSLQAIWLRREEGDLIAEKFPHLRQLSLAGCLLESEFSMALASAPTNLRHIHCNALSFREGEMRSLLDAAWQRKRALGAVFTLTVNRFCDGVTDRERLELASLADDESLHLRGT